MVIILVAVAFISSIIIMANLYQIQQVKIKSAPNGVSPINKNIINGLLFIMASMIIVFGGIVFLNSLPIATNIADDTPSISIPSQIGIGFLLVCLILGLFSIILIFSQKLRQFLQQYIVMSNGTTRRYHANSVVHTLAIILMLFASMNTIGNFILAGGIAGLAEELTDIGIADLLVNFAMYLVISLLGVGIFVRRTISRVMIRLGFRLPEKDKITIWLRNGTKHLIIGAVVGFGMFWVQVGLSVLWQASVSPETLAEQSAAAQAMFAAFSGSLWLGFLLALTAGIGEELLFRGALQPIFGNIIVSIFFVMLHSQYILTPASLIILTVSLVFGFLRSQYTTPSAMMAHFVYNFTPFVLISILTQWGIPLGSLTF